MFSVRYFFSVQVLLAGVFVLLPFYVHSQPCVFVPVEEINSCEVDEYGNSISEQIQGMVCPFPTLREAMADERMAQIIAGRNVFQTIESNDVVRLKEGVGAVIAFNPLKNKINETYRDFYKVAQTDFTLNIATYPADIKKGTCLDHSTIIKRPASADAKEDLEKEVLLDEEQVQSTSDTLGVEREVDGIFGDYVAVEGKSPRHFELRKGQDGKVIICEASKKSLSERMDLYCGGDHNDDKCEDEMPPLCSEWDENNAQFAGRKHSCSTLDAFENESADFLLNNMTMNNFCLPGKCSYYMQLLQRVRKDGEEHCVENHAIVHCGPRKKERKYNLNIKVVDDFCEDFNIMCVPPDQVASELAATPPEEEVEVEEGS
ncbi:MAG: hypothetical protein OXK80_01240 [Bdellovibrionales bacterium]|nr:hypothetical protein [Bdellovibrionales bacterium]